MKTLDENNKQTKDMFILNQTYPKNNGISCLKCNSELQDTNGNILLSNPPQYNVNCSKCDYTGYRL